MVLPKRPGMNSKLLVQTHYILVQSHYMRYPPCLLPEPESAKPGVFRTPRGTRVKTSWYRLEFPGTNYLYPGARFGTVVSREYPRPDTLPPSLMCI